MADLSDVTAYLAQAVAAIVYPNGSGSPSIAPAPAGFTNPADVRIFEGWPIADQLDLDLGGKQIVPVGQPPVARANGPMANVSIYPLPGNNRQTYQVLDKVYTITEPTFGLTVGLAAGVITVTGTGNTGEFLTVIADNQNVFSVSASGLSAMTVIAALLAAAQTEYPLATSSGNTLTIPATINLAVRQGGVGLLGKVTHRQCQEVMITVWAPDHNTRSVLAAAIDVALKETILVTLPDTSEMKVVYERTMVTDDYQNVTAYRRDLVFDCEYATLDTFPGTLITSLTISSGTTPAGVAPILPTVINPTANTINVEIV